MESGRLYVRLLETTSRRHGKMIPTDGKQESPYRGIRRRHRRLIASSSRAKGRCEPRVAPQRRSAR
ncbi:hypothetical protein EYF80_032963 [Liparis tanakae]|uniref:Uncharacterized protein n=1 Tax=Liparis tanakae TaxID=230148 RepID=A0A4Z2GUG0_9TELE|nr:hypothetical protein EYF80_032963 [Liparis tanakae]